MKPLIFCVALAVLPLCGQPQSAATGPQELAKRLHQLQAELTSQTVSSVLADLPAAWDVATPERRYSISTEPLRSLLMAAPSDQATRNNGIRQAKAWLDHVAQQLDAFASAPADTIPNARGQLDRILARPEFAGVRPPSAWDLMRARIAARIASFIQRFFAFAAQHPTGGQVLFWVLMVGGVGLLAVWLIRFWMRRDPIFTLPKPPPVVRSQSWEAWIRAAREAADRGDPREAIHCAYWAAVAHLQEGHILPEDLTHTPREYLRLMSQARPSAPGDSRVPVVDPLTTLTRLLERFWYGGQPAATDDFHASLKQLEALGCKVD
jgi:Domain of unknown function (DUF4129)